jgi:RNA polymerase sigma-70 factor (ECF subfamily)
MNLCYNQLPKLRKELRSLEQGNGQVQLVETNPEMNPAAHLEGKETIAFVHQQIKSLPSQHQILLMLRYQQGCSYTEISEILDLPLGTVKTGIFRARERLKEVVYHLQKEWVRL